MLVYVIIITAKLLTLLCFYRHKLLLVCMLSVDLSDKMDLIISLLIVVSSDQMDIAKVHVAINTNLECGVCFQVYEDPRGLPCGHTFCFKCISKVTNQLCPTCRAEWSHPLQKNFALNSCISSLPSSISECALAKFGDSHSKVEYLCISCKPRLSLCDMCAQGHITFTPNHVVKKINEIDQSDIESHKQEDTLMCIKHVRQELTLYCNTCEEFGCNTCYISFHNKHNYISVEKLDKQITTRLNEIVAKLQNNLREQDGEIQRLLSILKILNENKGKFEDDINVFIIKDVKQKLQEEFDKIMNEIDECHKRVVQIANEKVTAEVEDLKQIIADAEAQSQNFQKTLEVVERHLSSSIVERFRIASNNGDNKVEKSTIVVDSSKRTLADSSKWKSEVKNWLQLVLTEIGNAHFNIPLPAPQIGDVAVTVPKSRSVKCT